MPRLEGIGIIILSMVVVGLGIAWVSTVIYVVLHFATKYW